MSSVKYRSEIDGLRAVAVVPVILFHAHVPGFSGGFVGVDVFFVISGYLITTIIADDRDKGQFSLLAFYERRARRILPALLVVLACCVAAAALLLLPGYWPEFSESIFAVTVFASNIFFWHAVGYFATPAASQPLLHTWTLAVEEQFYIFFPLLLGLLWKLGRQWLLPALIAMALPTARPVVYRQVSSELITLMPQNVTSDSSSSAASDARTSAPSPPKRFLLACNFRL